MLVGILLFPILCFSDVIEAVRIAREKIASWRRGYEEITSSTNGDVNNNSSVIVENSSAKQADEETPFHGETIVAEYQQEAASQ